MKTKTCDWETTTWEACYPSNWKGIIINEAMAHPAKYSSRLIRRIYEHARELDWVKRGDRVIDPFGGVALGAWDALQLGLDWTGVELEARFIDLGDHYECPGFSKSDWVRFFGRASKVNLKRGFHWCPECLNKMTEIESNIKKGDTLDMFGNHETLRKIPDRAPHLFQGNIAAWNSRFSGKPNWGSARLLNGDSRKLLEVIGAAERETRMVAMKSPPYADSVNQSDGANNSIERLRRKQAAGVDVSKAVNRGGPNSVLNQPQVYGATPGQLGAMSEKGFDSAISSPPYNLPMSQSHNGKNGGTRGDTPSEPGAFVRYGNTPGNLEGMSDGDFAAAISSPPYSAMQVEKNSESIDRRKQYAVYKLSGGGQSFEAFCKTQEIHSQGYGKTEGNLSQMPASGFDLSLASPPFLQATGGTPEPKPGGSIDQSLYARHAAGNANAHGYGQTDGQLSSMADDGFDAAIGSPQKADSLSRDFIDSNHRRAVARAAGISNAEHVSPIDADRLTAPDEVYGTTPGQLGAMNGKDFTVAISSPPYEAEVVKDRSSHLEKERMKAKGYIPKGTASMTGDLLAQETYGHTDGQLADESGGSFWLAARQIVDQVYAALKPGGHAIWVVKGYVKNKKYVDFPDQWRQLCEAAGFVTLHEHRAMLVHSKGTSHTLEGGQVEHKTESKSFFRRLAEKKGSPRIDWETVWCMVKEGGDVPA